MLQFIQKSAVIFAVVVMSNTLFAADLTIEKPEQLKADASSIVVFEADWCGTCKEQKKILSSLLQQNKYKNIKHYIVNFDSQKSNLRNFKVTMQSTIVAYKNGAEVKRVTGETQKAAIQNILDQTL
jgi:thioredoxin 1